MLKSNVHLGYLLQRKHRLRQNAERCMAHGELNAALAAYRELDKVLQTLQGFGMTEKRFFRAPLCEEERPYQVIE